MKKRQIDLILIFVGRVVIAVQSLVAVRLSTAMLEPNEIGRVNLVLSVTSWFVLLLISPVNNYVFRQTVEWYAEKKLNEVLQRFGLFLAGVAVLATAILALVHFTIGIGTPIHMGWLLWLVIASLLFNTLNVTFITILNTLGYRSLYVIFMNLSLWLGLGAALGLIVWGGKQAEYWMTGLLLGQIAVMIPSGLAILKLPKQQSVQFIKSGNTAGFDVRSVFVFSWPLIITTGFYWMQTNGYRFVLVGFTDAATIGLFTIGLTIGVAPMKMFETVFTEYYQPIFYRDIAFTDTHQKAQAWNRYISAYFPSIILMGSFIGFGGPFLARLLVSESFHQVSWLSLWGVLTQLALMVYAAYVSFSFALLDTRRLMISNFFGALVAIGGTLLLAPWQPLLGTAIALFLAMFVTMLITAFNLGIDFPLRLPWRRLGKAGALALPLMLMMELLSRIFLDPTVLQSFMSLTITGIYMLFAQFILARKWIFSKSSIVKTQN